MNTGQAISRGIHILRRSASVTPSLTGLKNPDNWLTNAFSLGGAYYSQDSGVPVNGKSIQQIPTYISGVKLLAETMGSISGKLIFKTDDQRTVLSDDPRHYLAFRKPSRMMTANVFYEVAMKYAIHYGNFFAIIMRDQDMRVTELIPVHESRSVKIIQTMDELYYDIEGVGTLAAYNVLHIKGMGDGIIGIGAIEYAATSAGITLATQKNQAKFYKSGSQLQGYISHPKSLKTDTIKRLRESWHSVYHSGGDNSQTAFLDEGMEYKTISVTPEAAKYLETLKNGYYDIAAILRIPPHMLGLMDKSSFNNIEHQGLEFVKYTFLPWVRKFENELWDKLLTEQEKRADQIKFRFNLETILRGDYKTRMEGYRIGIHSGLFSQNDCRALEDMPPIEGGDKHWIQMNMMPIEDSEEILNRAADQLALQSIKNGEDEKPN